MAVVFNMSSTAGSSGHGQGLRRFMSAGYSENPQCPSRTGPLNAPPPIKAPVMACAVILAVITVAAGLAFLFLAHLAPANVQESPHHPLYAILGPVLGSMGIMALLGACVYAHRDKCTEQDCCRYNQYRWGSMPVAPAWLPRDHATGNNRRPDTATTVVSIDNTKLTEMEDGQSTVGENKMHKIEVEIIEHSLQDSKASVYERDDEGDKVEIEKEPNHIAETDKHREPD